mgnify:CR=1 FL=1
MLFRSGVYYAGFPAGGVWKTTSAGMTWTPIFDDIKSVSSIGAVEVAPSDPNVVYVGTGDMITGGVINEGDGVYRSADAGKSWQRAGLAASKQIPSMLVDLRNPNVVLVAAQGDIHQPTEDRGIFRTEDGGNIFDKGEPYLKGVECSLEGRRHFDPFMIKTVRTPAKLRDAANVELARLISLFASNGFYLAGFFEFQPSSRGRIYKFIV